MKRKLLALLGFAAAAALAATAADTDLSARAKRLHASSIVVDTHLDLPYRLEDTGWVDIGQRQTTGHVDVPRMKEGGLTLGFFAAYVPASYAEKGGAAKKALEQIELIHRLAETTPGLVFADSIEEVRAAKKAGKIALTIGIEGGHAIEDSLGAIGSFRRLGVRYMTLTHTNTNNWADSSGSFWRHDFDPATYRKHGGLSDLGREVVREMNRVGMMVDVSHVSDETIADVLEVSAAPVFASHSSCRALSNIPRNLTDDQIREIGRRGGIVMVNISSFFLSQKSADDFVAQREALRPKIAEMLEAGKADPEKAAAAVSKLLDDIAYVKADWTVAVDHIERVLRVGGPGSAGIGSDFDGIEDPPLGLEDISKLPKITEELLRRGHSEEEVRGVLGESFLKFWERVERARAKAPARAPGFPFTKPGAVPAP
ncbi:MAG TPA: dipeptidase [Thermoanaerobaculia bacterium]